MAIQKQIFGNIGDLLQALNTQYLNLTENEVKAGSASAALFEATAKYLVSSIEFLNAGVRIGQLTEKNAGVEDPIENAQTAKQEDKIPFNSYFTPPSDLVRGKQESKNEAPVITSEPDQSSLTNVSEEIPVEEKTEEVVESHVVEDTEVYEQPVQVSDPIKQEVVVQEVIEEPKEVTISTEVTKEEKPARPLTLNEIISQQKQAGVHNRVYQVNQSTAPDKLIDFKTGVSLNDKLLFIKDLFNGYSLAYSEAIELLNRFNSYAEADAFLQTNYAVKNKWSEKPQTVEKLYDILRRRYS